MGLSGKDKKIITGTEAFWEAIETGSVDPESANDLLFEYVGKPEDHAEDYRRRWEMLIISTVANKASQLFDTFPVVIGDYSSSATRPWQKYSGAGQYVWLDHQRPARRPRPPHRIEDSQLIQLANTYMGVAASTDEIILIPVIADYEGRSVFEIAMLVVFPACGAYAFRRRANVSGKYDRGRFRRMIEEHESFEGISFKDDDWSPEAEQAWIALGGNQDPLPGWIYKTILGHPVLHDWYENDALTECSCEAMALIEYFAGAFYDQRQRAPRG